MDYYSILGVSKNSTEKDIKTAFRKLAAKHHPDKGGDHKKFVEIKEAYETLSDPVKRQQYDNPQPRFNFNSNQFHANDINDIFSTFFGQQQTRQARNPDIRIRVNIELEEVITGKQIIVSYRLQNGVEKSVDLNIPPGAKDGDTIRFRGLGETVVPTTPGDLLLIISVKQKLAWQRSGNDLLTTVKVNCLDLITGTKVTVNTLDRRTFELKVPRGTKHGTVFSLTDCGVPNIKTGHKGKLLVSIESIVPQIDDDNLIERIKEIKNAIN